MLLHVQVLPLQRPVFSTIKTADRRCFIVPSKVTDTFGQVWRKCEERYRDNYSEGQRNDWQFVKLTLCKEETNFDIDLRDTVGDIFAFPTVSSPSNVINIHLAPITRELSVPIGSHLINRAEDQNVLEARQQDTARRREETERYGDALENICPDDAIPSAEQAHVPTIQATPSQEDVHMGGSSREASASSTESSSVSSLSEVSHDVASPQPEASPLQNAQGPTDDAVTHSVKANTGTTFLDFLDQVEAAESHVAQAKRPNGVGEVGTGAIDGSLRMSGDMTTPATASRDGRPHRRVTVEQTTREHEISDPSSAVPGSLDEIPVQPATIRSAAGLAAPARRKQSSPVELTRLQARVFDEAKVSNLFLTHDHNSSTPGISPRGQEQSRNSSEIVSGQSFQPARAETETSRNKAKQKARPVQITEDDSSQDVSLAETPGPSTDKSTRRIRKQDTAQTATGSSTNDSRVESAGPLISTQLPTPAKRKGKQRAEPTAEAPTAARSAEEVDASSLRKSTGGRWSADELDLVLKAVASGLSAQNIFDQGRVPGRSLRAIMHKVQDVDQRELAAEQRRLANHQESGAYGTAGNGKTSQIWSDIDVENITISLRNGLRAPEIRAKFFSHRSTQDVITKVGQVKGAMKHKAHRDFAIQATNAYRARRIQREEDIGEHSTGTGVQYTNVEDMRLITARAAGLEVVRVANKYFPRRNVDEIREKSKELWQRAVRVVGALRPGNVITPELIRDTLPDELKPRYDALYEEARQDREEFAAEKEAEAREKREFLEGRLSLREKHDANRRRLEQIRESQRPGVPIERDARGVPIIQSTGPIEFLDSSSNESSTDVSSTVSTDSDVDMLDVPESSTQAQQQRIEDLASQRRSPVVIIPPAPAHVLAEFGIPAGSSKKRKKAATDSAQTKLSFPRDKGKAAYQTSIPLAGASKRQREVSPGEGPSTPPPRKRARPSAGKVQAEKVADKAPMSRATRSAAPALTSGLAYTSTNRRVSSCHSDGSAGMQLQSEMKAAHARSDPIQPNDIQVMTAAQVDKTTTTPTDRWVQEQVERNDHAKSVAANVPVVDDEDDVEEIGFGNGDMYDSDDPNIQMLGDEERLRRMKAKGKVLRDQADARSREFIRRTAMMQGKTPPPPFYDQPNRYASTAPAGPSGLRRQDEVATIFASKSSPIRPPDSTQTNSVDAQIFQHLDDVSLIPDGSTTSDSENGDTESERDDSFTRDAMLPSPNEEYFDPTKPTQSTLASIRPDFPSSGKVRSPTPTAAPVPPMTPESPGRTAQEVLQAMTEHRPRRAPISPSPRAQRISASQPNPVSHLNLSRLNVSQGERPEDSQTSSQQYRVHRRRHFTSRQGRDKGAEKQPRHDASALVDRPEFAERYGVGFEWKDNPNESSARNEIARQAALLQYSMGRYEEEKAKQATQDKHNERSFMRRFGLPLSPHTSDSDMTEEEDSSSSSSSSYSSSDTEEEATSTNEVAKA